MYAIRSYYARLRAVASGAPAPEGAAPQVAPGATGDIQHRMDLIAGRVEQLAENNKGLASKIEQRGIAQHDEFETLAKRVDTIEATRAEAASVLKLNDRISEVENVARA